MCGLREFEEGMCNQDIERFRTGEGIPLDTPPDDDIYDEASSDYWLNDL